MQARLANDSSENETCTIRDPAGSIIHNHKIDQQQITNEATIYFIALCCFLLLIKSVLSKNCHRKLQFTQFKHVHRRPIIQMSEHLSQCTRYHNHPNHSIRHRHRHHHRYQHSDHDQHDYRHIRSISMPTSVDNVGNTISSMQIASHSQQNVRSEKLKDIILRLRQGICIIRLISLDRFLQIPIKQKRKQQLQSTQWQPPWLLWLLLLCQTIDRHSWPQLVSTAAAAIASAMKRLSNDITSSLYQAATARVLSQILVLVKCVFGRVYSCDGMYSKENGNVNGQCQFYSHLPMLQRTLLLLMILLSSLCQSAECFHGNLKVSASTHTVKTKYGQLRGIVLRTTPLVEAYLGIPYASPPVGSLRFMPPITPSTWKNIRNADRFAPVCPQTVPIPPNGPEALLEVPRARLAQLRRLLPLLSNQSEDCLYLNIYVPYDNRRHRRSTSSTSSSSSSSPNISRGDSLLPGKLSTVLFIHGESYEWNSGNPYDGSELAANGNVIVVTINFRLGILGFLKTGGKESAQGNFGLMDLVAGLHWLKENLPAFGGNPNSITLLGHGTGAALANILIVSPVASDLIQRTVLVSGSALSPWAIQKNPLFVKRRVAEQTGCHGDMLYDDLAPCLRTKSVNELLSVKIDHPRFLVGFAPFVDGTVISPYTDTIGALTLPLGSAIVSTSGIEFANFPKRDLIFCLTSIESYLDLSAQDLEFGFNETRRDRILRTFVRNNFHYHLNEIFAVLKNEYTDWEKAIRNPLSSRDATLSFLSDGHTASALIKLGYMHSLRGGRSFFLHFKHKTIAEEFTQRTGSVRGEDVPFWLGLPVSPLFPHNYTTQEKQISRLMLRYLANFAKTGNPNQPTQTSELSSTSVNHRQNIDRSNNRFADANNMHVQSKRAVQKSSDSSSKIMDLTNSSGLGSGSAAGSSASASANVNTANKQNKFGTTAQEMFDLAIIYNQRRSNGMRDKRINYKRHMRSNDDAKLLGVNSGYGDGSGLPFWDAYDVVNQLYLELGNKAEVQTHYRGHKLSMWLNLIPQLHKHSNIVDQSMRHHQFHDDYNNRDLYEGIVRPQLQIKPQDEQEIILLQAPRSTVPAKIGNISSTLGSGSNSQTGSTTTECGIDSVMYVSDSTTLPPVDNRSIIDGQKDLATASTGIIGNLEVLRRLSGKQFQSYTTALIATVAVGCFLLILNILIFAGIYHQREKRARDSKTKEELQDSDTSKNSSIIKLNTVGLSMGDESVYNSGGKTSISFGEYNCYDEKSKQLTDEKLIVEMPPQTSHMLDTNWACSSTSTLDLLKTKPSTEAKSIKIFNSQDTNDEHMHSVANMEMATYSSMPMVMPTVVESIPVTVQSKRSSFVGTTILNPSSFDYAVQSSDQMSFKDIENAVTVTSENIIVEDIEDDIPEPPPPPRSFQNSNIQQQQHQQQQQGQQGGGILRQAGAGPSSQSGGKKRVHIQEISV